MPPKLISDNVNLTDEILALTCYARKLERKLESADEELNAEIRKTEEADQENEQLLQVKELTLLLK